MIKLFLMVKETNIAYWYSFVYIKERKKNRINVINFIELCYLYIAIILEERNRKENIHKLYMTNLVSLSESSVSLSRDVDDR